VGERLVADRACAAARIVDAAAADIRRLGLPGDRRIVGAVDHRLAPAAAPAAGTVRGWGGRIRVDNAINIFLFGATDEPVIERVAKIAIIVAITVAIACCDSWSARRSRSD
jgi:hypothetical protein